MASSPPPSSAPRICARRARRRVARHPRLPRERDAARPDRARAVHLGALRFLARQDAAGALRRDRAASCCRRGSSRATPKARPCCSGAAAPTHRALTSPASSRRAASRSGPTQPGFFSADPKAVPSARLIKSLHYREAQEIASAGGGILHPRSISPVRATGIPLYLKCTTHPEWEGSVISNAPGDDQPQLKAISHRSGITLVSMESMEMWHQVGFLADAFECLSRARHLRRPDLDLREQRHGLDRHGAKRHEPRRHRGARRRSAQALQGHDHQRLRRDHARRPADPHDPARARTRARGVPGAAGPSRDAGRERPEPHVRRELGARLPARAAPARPARRQVRGRRVRRDLGAAHGRRRAGEDAAEAVVGQEEGAAARDRRATRRHLRLRPRDHRKGHRGAARR